MKKTFKTLLFAMMGLLALASCEDVPAPYNVPDSGKQKELESQYLYSSSSCSDWSVLVAASGNNPWSQGGSYTQATGYQKWNGADAKSNRMADGYLISPAFKTTTENSVYISFQYCVAYVNNDAQFADHIKLYVSSQYNADEGFVPEKWTQLDWKATHTSTNWELETTTIVLPAEFLNKEQVHVAFYFTTPSATASSTFEIKDFKVVAGTPSEGGNAGGESSGAITCAQALEIINSLSDGGSSEDSYTITGYIVDAFTISGKPCFWMSDTKGGEKIIQAYNASLPQGVTSFQVGMKVTATGKLKKYVNKNTGDTTPEVENATVVILENGDGSSQGGGQGSNAEHITIAEFLAKADVNTTYELTGIVRNISNTKFGNFDLVEGDASIYIYGLLDLQGNKQNFASLGIVEGDEVTLTGKYKLYNDKAEIVDAQFISVKKGDAGQGGDEGGGDPVDDLVNGDFEIWEGDPELPTGWKSASNVSNAELSKSIDPRGGSYACIVKAPGTANKRLATQEIALEAGSYTFSYYAKSSTTDICQTRGGYVVVENGTALSNGYHYGSYTNINNTEWTLITYDFTLDNDAVVCLIVMNPKESAGKTVSQDILVDDATLVKK